MKRDPQKTPSPPQGRTERKRTKRGGLLAAFVKHDAVRIVDGRIVPTPQRKPRPFDCLTKRKRPA